MRAVPPHVVTFPCVILSSLFLPLTVLQPIDWWFCARSFVLIVLDTSLLILIFDYYCIALFIIVITPLKQQQTPPSCVILPPK